jgi:cytochrome c biogenesis protein CcdA
MLSITLSALSVPALADNGPLTLAFFGSRNCGECLEIKDTLLKPLEAQYPGVLKIKYYETEDPESFQLMLSMEKRYKVTKPSPQELYFPDGFLLGYDEIMKDTRRLVEARISCAKKPSAPPVEARRTGALPAKAIRPLPVLVNATTHIPAPPAFTATTTCGKIAAASYAEDLQARFAEFSFLSIMAAGVIDGINPCAIATMIFLISFLATKKKSRREILVVGLCFTATVFLTYLLLGVGAFKVITMLEQYRWISKFIRWSAVALAGGVGLFSFYDAFIFSRTGKTKDLNVQLPDSVKRQIHKVISGNLSGGQLAAGAIVTGFLVTLLEAVCTGQVYLPTILLMTKQTGMRFIGWAYLIFYNFLFVLPLLIIMVLAYYGLKWDTLAKATQKRMFAIKVSFGVVLIALAVFLAVAG